MMSRNTVNDIANVMFTSAVGTARKWPKPSFAAIHGSRSSGSRSIAFMKKTHMKMVSASGARNRRSPWKTSFTWPSTNSTIISTNAWPLDGTPEVALRAFIPNHSTNSTPRSSETNRESMWNDQNPPSLTCGVRWVRWCWMYSVSPPSALLTFSILESQTQNACDQCRAESGDQHHRRQPPLRQGDPQAAADDQPLEEECADQPCERRTTATCGRARQR